jgi:hypothetical protein
MSRLMMLVIVAGFSAAVTAGGAQTAASPLQQRIARLSAVTERVEALSAVKRLQHAYGHYSELGLWHDFADLFADTGIGYYTQGALDREGIRSLFLKEVGGGRLGLAHGRIYPHISMQPLVTLSADGQSANGRWRIMAMLGGYNANASWSGGVYQNQYVRENGVWKFKEVRYLPQYSGRYENPGWTPAKDDAPFDFDDSIPADGGFRLNAAEAAGAAEPAEPLSALGQRVADLAARAERLHDEIELTNLQHTYGYYVDRRMWSYAAALFAPDGTMENGLQGVYVGPASIRDWLKANGGENRIDDHVHLQTIVSVSPDGRTARARGTDFGMSAAGGRALLTQSIYENEFVKQGRTWKFKAMHVHPRFIVDAAQGWGKSAIEAPGPRRDYPPNRASTDTYEIFPRFHIAPLHFNHPVTGRAPQYPEGTRSAGASGFSRIIETTPAPAKTLAAIERLLTATERSISRIRAYHAAENLASAHGYSSDEAAWTRKSFTLHQIVQPVIDVDADGRNANVRARLFQMGNTAAGEGTWTSGVYEGRAVVAGGTWKLSRMNLNQRWTAPSRGGWASLQKP